jgi:hypothetical protein
MRILGYINHSAPAHLPALSELDTEFNAPSGLPHGTVVFEAPLRRIKNVTWPAYLLNELHIQIRFILEESGFLRLQRKGFRWNLHYNTKINPVCTIYHWGHRGARPSLWVLHGTIFKDTTTLSYL